MSLISVCNGIVAAEELRVTAEASRVSAEGERAEAEASRVSAEQARASAESGRASAESARANAESSRATAEQGRVTAEQSRVTAETARASAETARETAESERETAETARTSAETSRVTAEQGRVSAENTRVSQEQERQAEILKIAGMTVEVTTLAAGAQATAELVESGGHKVLKLGIPKGQDGSVTDTVVTASASAWSDNTITLSVTGVKADSKLEIGLSDTATDEQYAAATAAQIRATGSGDGTVTLKAATAPTIDLPIIIRRLS